MHNAINKSMLTEVHLGRSLGVHFAINSKFYLIQVVMNNGLAPITLTTPEGMMAGIEYKGVKNLLETEFPPGG